MKRKKISLKTQLAAALLQIRDASSERLIPHDDAKLMSACQIISLFHLDHQPIPHADGGPDEPWNLTHLFIGAHREKTAKRDIPQIAKGKRIRATNGLLTAKRSRTPMRSGYRKFTKGKKLRSRSTFR